MNKNHVLKVADTETLQQIHSASLRLLAETGVVFDSADIIERFRKQGVKISGRKVYFSEAVIAEALTHCPRSFTMVGRNNTAPVCIGKDQPSPVVAPGNGTLFIQELSGERRRATLDDFNSITKLCQSSRNVDLIGSIPVDPCDIQARSKPARLVHHLMQYSNKPLIGAAATHKEAAELFDVIEIAFGQDRFLEDHVAISYGMAPASPLCFEPLTCETMAAYAQRKQALFILPGIMPGLTGPLDAMGLVVLSNAENLAAITAIQLMNPGTPVVYSAGTLMVNMTNLYAVTGSPQANLVNIAGIQMAREFYQIPSRTMAGLTDAKHVDYQAGAETMQNLALYTQSGVHLINECLGVLDSIMSTSFEKWVLDDELLDRLDCFARGFDQMRVENVLDVIKAVGPGGSYLQHPTTLDNCKSLYMPEISDWNPYEIWQNEAETDILKKARSKYETILAGSREKVLPPEVERDISAYLNHAT